MLSNARPLAWLLIPALSATPIAERSAAAQDDFDDPMDDEFIQSDDSEQAGGRERWTWPRVARIDPERQTVTLEWSP